MAKPSPKHAGEKVLVDLGIAIRNARKEAGLSQEALTGADPLVVVTLGV